MYFAMVEPIVAVAVAAVVCTKMDASALPTTFYCAATRNVRQLITHGVDFATPPGNFGDHREAVPVSRTLG